MNRAYNKTSDPSMPDNLHEQDSASFDQPAPYGDTPCGPARCLVVDDDQIVHALLASFLMDEGLEAEFACSGEEAVRLAISFKPDIILMDIELPDMNGLEVARRIRRSDDVKSNPIIVAFTSTEAEQIRDRCFEAGIDSFLAKPFSRDNLRRLLKQLETFCPNTIS